MFYWVKTENLPHLSTSPLLPGGEGLVDRESRGQQPLGRQLSAKGDGPGPLDWTTQLIARDC